MNADQARKLSKQSNLTSVSQYPEIIKLIKGAAGKGDYFVFFKSEISEDVREKLVKDGYTVGKTTFDRNEPLTKINW